MTSATIVLVSCSYCDAELDPDAPSTYRRSQAWEKKGVLASRRGGSDLVLRESLDVFACTHCIDRLKRGVSIEQESLL